MVTPALYNKPISEILDYVKLHFPEAKYIAKDKSGFWYAHNQKPKYYVTTWLSEDLTHELPFIDHNNFSNDLVKIEKTDYKAECEKLKAECEKLQALIVEKDATIYSHEYAIKICDEDNSGLRQIIKDLNSERNTPQSNVCNDVGDDDDEFSDKQIENACRDNQNRMNGWSV